MLNFLIFDVSTISFILIRVRHAASQAGDAESSRIPNLASGFKGAVNFHWISIGCATLMVIFIFVLRNIQVPQNRYQVNVEYQRYE